MKTGGVLAVSIAFALVRAGAASYSVPTPPAQNAGADRRGSTRAEFVRENRERQKALTAKGKRASDDLRRQVREEVINQKINLAPLRQEIGYSLERAKLQRGNRAANWPTRQRKFCELETEGYVETNFGQRGRAMRLMSDFYFEGV